MFKIKNYCVIKVRDDDQIWVLSVIVKYLTQLNYFLIFEKILLIFFIKNLGGRGPLPQLGFAPL